MPNPRPWLSTFIASLAAVAVTSASAAGFGAGAPGAMLGQPLDFAVQVRLEPGEVLAPECVSAEVTIGDRRLAAAAVRTAVDMAGAELARIRVVTSITVDEPVVAVLINAGCASSRLSRRFVVFADPPIAPATTAATASVYAPAYAAAPADATAPAGALAGAGPDLGGAATAETPAPVRAVPPRRTAAADGAPARPRAAGRATRVERRAATRAAAGARQARKAVPSADPVAAATPRLRLEPAELLAGAQAIEQAMEAVAQAASAAHAAASAASAASDRIASLETTVSGLRDEAKASRELAVQLRERLLVAEQAGRWTWPLLAVVLALTGLAAWMAWRLNAADRSRQRGWQNATVAPPVPGPVSGPISEMTPSKLPTAPIPFVTSEIKLPPTPSARPRSVPAWPAPAPIDSSTMAMAGRTTLASSMEDTAIFPYDTAMQRTQPMPPAVTVSETTPRDVSIEELIDLEQQAEFFVVLGQDDAAVELLVEHLRHTGGGSPLPYLKLLEIYRRRGDRDDYERMRARFNHRFNAYAPAWEVDLQAGRTLDAYPGVIPRLQQVWARPLDAMAELEALLFRKSRGDLFELPAYREVLFLYSLARDLLDREAADTGNVDLLLPLADGSEFSSTSPAPFMGLEREGGLEHAGSDDRPTAPVDFDLTSDRAKPTSLFGPLDDADDRPSRR